MDDKDEKGIKKGKGEMKENRNKWLFSSVIPDIYNFLKRKV